MLLPTSKSYSSIRGLEPRHYAETGKGQIESHSKEEQIQEPLIMNALLPGVKKAWQCQLLQQIWAGAVTRHHSQAAQGARTQTGWGFFGLVRV